MTDDEKKQEEETHDPKPESTQNESVHPPDESKDSSKEPVHEDSQSDTIHQQQLIGSDHSSQQTPAVKSPSHQSPVAEQTQTPSSSTPQNPVPSQPLQVPQSTQPGVPAVDPKAPKQKKESAIVIVDQKQLRFLNIERGTTLQFPFPPDVVKYMDVLDEETFINQIKGFIRSNHLPPSTVAIILAEPVLFEKIVQVPADLPKDQKDKEVEKFVDYVPFDSVGFVTLPDLNGIRVIGGNLSMAQFIKSAFEETGSTVVGAYPQTALPADIGASSGITAVNGRVILQRSENLRPLNIIPVTAAPVSALFQPIGSKEGGNPTQPQSKKRLYLLGAVFGILLLVLIVLAYTTFATPQPTGKTTVKRPTPTVQR